MPTPDLLTTVATTLADLGVPHMLTGSLASSLHGEPRATHDIDLVVDMPADRIAPLLAAFPPPRYYADANAAREALRSRRMFNVVDLDSGEKVDFWLLTDDPFDRSRFARRETFDLGGTPLPVSTPEDTILMKLKWSRDSGGSEKQFHDALRVYESQRDRLDEGYLENWIDPLGIRDLWSRLQAVAKPRD